MRSREFSSCSASTSSGLADCADVDALFGKLAEIFAEYYRPAADRPVLQARPNSELLQSLHLKHPPEAGAGIENTLAFFESEVLAPSVHTWNPYFLNQNFAGAAPVAVVGDFLASMMNPTLATREAAPAATIIEQDVASWMAELLGMAAGSGGILLPGGSLSNLLGLALARDSALADGEDPAQLFSKNPVIFASKAAHYSVRNAISLLGFPASTLTEVEVDEDGAMLPESLSEELRNAVQQGRRPLAIIATLGTTCTGAFDPLPAIVDLAQSHKTYLHVDAAFGGGMALAARRRRFFAGIEHAQSVVWDAHKCLQVPLACSALLVPDTTVLKRTFCPQAGYLFHASLDDFDIEDLGTHTILCGKRFESLKLWFLWRSLGTKHFRAFAEDRAGLCEFVEERLAAEADFIPAHRVSAPVVCMRYEPKRLLEGGTLEVSQRGDAMHRWIRETARERGLAFFNIAEIRGRLHFRIVFNNPLFGREEFERLLAMIRGLGREYFELQQPVRENRT